MTITITLGMSREKIQRNNIRGMKKKNVSLSILAENKFLLYSSRIKRMKMNAKEKQFLVNDKKKLGIVKNTLFHFIIWSPITP